MSEPEKPELPAPQGFRVRPDKKSAWLEVPPEHRETVARDLFEVEKGDYFEHLRIQASVAVSAIRTLFLLNGGAIIAILTFIGNHATDADGGKVRTALLLHSVGLVLAAAAQIPGYVAQIDYQEASKRLMFDYLRHFVGGQAANDHVKHGEAGWKGVTTGLLFAIGSLLAFITGAYFGIDSLRLQ